MEKCYLIQWPESQRCIRCEHGTFIMGEEDDIKVGDSAYLCFHDSHDILYRCPKKMNKTSQSSACDKFLNTNYE